MLLDPKTQVAFNLKKGSLPVRGDVDLTAANDCMKKGLDILAAGNIIPGTDQLSDAGHAEAERRPVRRVLRQSEPDAGRRPEALRRDHRSSRLIDSARPQRAGLVADGPARSRTCVRKDRHDAQAQTASEPAVPQPEREDRLDSDDPDGASSSSSAARSGRSLYSFTNSKLLPRLQLRRPRPVRAAVGDAALAGLDREPCDLRHPVARSSRW